MPVRAPVSKVFVRVTFEVVLTPFAPVYRGTNTQTLHAGSHNQTHTENKTCPKQG